MRRNLAQEELAEAARLRSRNIVDPSWKRRREKEVEVLIEDKNATSSYKLTHGSLFSGIGGFDLAAHWMGWENVFHCECNDFAKRVLKYYWPKANSYEDITKTDFSIHKGKIDILTGGFPCQPYSSAGKRLGKEDDRHLWPEMLRAIREIEPKYIVAENVYGLINWNGGLVFNEVQVDLENEGYKVQPCILPACGVGAPHRRDRVWFIASDALSHSNSSPRKSSITKGKGGERFKREKERRKRGERVDGLAGLSRASTYFDANLWENFPSQPAVCSGDDGIPQQLDGITFSKWRQESIKSYGNAIVPQVAYQIFKAIMITERKERKEKDARNRMERRSSSSRL